MFAGIFVLLLWLVSLCDLLQKHYIPILCPRVCLCTWIHVCLDACTHMCVYIPNTAYVFCGLVYACPHACAHMCVLERERQFGAREHEISYTSYTHTYMYHLINIMSTSLLNHLIQALQIIYMYLVNLQHVCMHRSLSRFAGLLRAPWLLRVFMRSVLALVVSVFLC